MKKIWKALSLMMALALVVCSLSTIVFAKELKSYVTQPTDGYYHYNIDPTATEDDAEDIGAAIYDDDNSRNRIYVYYKVDEDGKLVNCDIDDGENRGGHDDSIYENFWHQALKRDAVIIGTVTKVEKLTGYHFEQVTDVAKLEDIADDVSESDLDNVLAMFFDIASPILCDNNYNGGNVAFFYMSEEKNIEGSIDTVYSGFEFYSGGTIEVDAASIQDTIDENGYVYVLVPDAEPETTEETTEAPTTEEATTEAPTTEEATTEAPTTEEPTTEATPDATSTEAAATTTAAAASATATKTGDNNMAFVFIALSVVAASGLVVVTFASKKNK